MFGRHNDNMLIRRQQYEPSSQGLAIGQTGESFNGHDHLEELLV